MNGPARQQRRAILQRLVDTIGETCNLTALAGACSRCCRCAAIPAQRFVDREALGRELSETRRRRIGINRSEHLRGLNGVAVPVMLDRQRACAAVAVQAPEGRMTLDELLAQVPPLQAAAQAMRATFG